MANVLVRSAKAAAQRNKKRKKEATVSGAKATAYSLNEQKEQEKKADQGYHPGSPSTRAKSNKKQSDYAIKLGQSMDTGVSDWFVQQAGGINAAQRGANPGGLKAPGRRTDRNDKPISQDLTKQIHDKHQQNVENVLAWQSEKTANNQAKMEELKKNLTPIQKWGLDLGYTAAQMGLDIGASALMGGGTVPFMSVMGVRSYGASYEQAKSGGATDKQASAFALANAGKEILTEKIFAVGGALKTTMGKGLIDVEKLFRIGTGDILKSTAGREMVQAVSRFGLTASTEGAEEFVAGMIEPILRKYTYSNEELDLGEMLKSSLYDATIGAALGAGFGMVDVGTAINSGKILNNSETVTALVDEGLASGENTKSYKIAKSMAKRLAKGMEPTNLELNRLRNENAKAINEEQAQEEKIRSATDRVISQKVGPEYASRDMDIDEQHQYYEALQEQGYTEEAPVAVREYGRIRNEVFNIMEPKAQAIGREKDPELNNDLTAISRIIMGQGTAEDISRMYPANPMAREVFTAHTGIELPPSNAETRAVLLDFTENKRVALADIEKNPGKVMLREDVLSAYERAGKIGTPIEPLNKKYAGILSEAEAVKAYEKGAENKPEAGKGPATQKKGKNRSPDRVGSRSGFVNESSKPVQKKVETELNAASEYFGVPIVMVDEISAIVDGKKVYANGAYENGTIKVSRRAANPLRVVFSHEVCHHLKVAAPKEYQELQDFARNAMFESDPIDFGAKMKRYAKLYGNKDEDFLMDEIMADSAHEIMEDMDLWTKLAADHANLAQKFLNFLKKFINSMKSMFEGGGKDGVYASLGIKEEMVSLMAEAIKAARANPTVSVEVEAKYQLVGQDKEGVEIYKTGDGTRAMSYPEKLRAAILLAENEFRGRTAKFTVNGDVAYARFLGANIRKNFFGDTKSSKKGMSAKANIFADNNYIELVENANYIGNKKEKGKTTKLHKGADEWYYFDKNVWIDGTYFKVFINLMKTEDGEYVYEVNLWNKKDKAQSTPSVAQKPGLNGSKSEDTSSDANISPSDEDVKRFSLSEAVEAKGGLIAAHNLNEGSLMESLRLGGFPMPSIAVTTAEMGHSNFGPVSVLFGPDTIDPSKSDNRVYSGDAWTPTFPQVGYKFDVNKLEEIQDRFMGYFGARDPYRLESKLDPDNIQNRMGKGDNSVFDVIRNDDGIMAAFLEESGIPYEKAYREKQYIEDPVVNEAVIEKFGIEKLRAWRNTNYAELEAEGAIKDLMDTINDAYEELYANATGKRIRVYSEDNFGFGKFDPTVRDIVKYYNEGRSKELDTYKTRDNIKAAVENHMDEYEAWGLKTFDGTIIQKGVRDPKVELFTRAGSRRGFDSLYMEYTLENIVKAMKAEPENGNQAFGITAGFLKGKIARRFKTIQDIKQNVDLLKEDATVESAYEELDNAISSIVHNMADKYISEHPDENQFFVYDEAAAVIVEAAESARTPAAIKKVLDQYNRRMESNDQIVNDIVGLFNAAIDLPVRLFESKPRRVVGLDEVRLVVLPEGTSQDILTALEQKNIPYDFYDADDDQSRINKVNSHDEVRWSLTDSEGVVLTPEQIEYFKDSKVRDEQGRLLLLYRSADGGRTVWDGRGKGTWAEGIFLTDSNEIARAYTFSRDPEVIQVYANGKRPFVVDAQGHHYQQIPIPESAPQSLKDWFWYDGTADADNLPRWAFQNGYDSVIIKNVREGVGGYPATDVILKDSNQIKLANNSAPTEDPDIRFSLHHGPEPKKTIKAYKLFRKKNGKLYPLYVRAQQAIPIGQWVDALEGERAETKAGKPPKVKASKLGALAYRPGWHAGNLPYADHITQGSDHVWAEVELNADIDYSKEPGYSVDTSQAQAGLIRGKDTNDRVMPTGGYYAFKTNTNASSDVHWLISGGLKINRILTRAEVNQINEQNGLNSIYRDVEYSTDIRYSLGSGFHAGDLGKAEGYYNMMTGSRGTGHFGTGTYFVSDPEKMKGTDYAKRPLHEVDFGAYNLYRPFSFDDGEALHDFLKEINNNILRLDRAKEDSIAVLREGHRIMDVAYDEDETAISEAFSKYGDVGFEYRAPGDYYEHYRTLSEHLEKIQEHLDELTDESIKSLEYESRTEYLQIKKQSLLYSFGEAYKTLYEDERRWYRLLDLTGLRLYEIDSNKVKPALDSVYDRLMEAKKNGTIVSKSDTPATMFMKHFGFDGVDVRHIKEMDNFKYGSVIYDVRQDDIKYSLQTEQDAARVRIREKIDELKTAFEEEKLAEQGILPDKDRMNQIQMQIRKDYNSQIKPSELVDGLTEIFVLLKTKEKDLDAAGDAATNLAKAIIGEGGVLNDQTAKEYKALKEYMRKKPLLIMDEHKGDFGYSEWNRFRKANFGRLNLSKQGQTIDQFYPELLQLFPGILDPEKSHPSDQLTHVLDVIKSLEPTFENYDTESYVGREMVDMLTIDILDFMFDLDPKKPLGPARSRAKYQRILEKIEQAADEYSTMAEEEKTNLRKYYEEKIANAEADTERDKTRARVERIEMLNDYKRLMAEMKAERDRQIEATKAEGEEKLKKQAAMYQDRIDRTKARFMERRSRTQMMESIRSNADYLAEALIHPSDQRHIPEGYQHAIAALLSGLNFESTHTDAWEKRMGTPGKRVMNLRELQMYYLRMMANTENAEIEPDPEMASLLDLMAKEVDGRRLSELTNEELANVRIILKSIRHTVSTINRTFNENIKENISELGEQIISDMRTGKHRKSHAGPWGTVLQYLNSDTVAPADFFAIAGGTLERMYYEVRKGFDRHVENSNQAMEYIRQAMEGTNKKDVRKWSEKYGTAKTFTLQNGHEIRLLPSQVMSLYALNLREQARKHIYGSGIVVSNLVAKKDKSVMKEVLESTHEMITYKDVQMIIGSLNDEQLAIANKLLRFITTTTSEWGNQTSMKLYGYRKFTEENYFPIKSSDVYLDESFEVRSDAKIKNLGFTKNTVANANNPIVIDDFFNVITDHITKMSMYNALVPALTDFERVYNYKQKMDTMSTDSVQNSVVYGLGQNGKLYIKKLMQNINGYYNKEHDTATIKAANKFLQNYKKASLGLNLRVLVQQPTSLIRASMVIDYVYLLEGMAQKTIGHATRKEMWEHIPIARWKSWGYAQTDVAREQKDIMMGITNVMDTVTMGAYGWADDISWTVLYAAVKAETKDKHPELVPDTPQYWEHIKDRFNQIVDRTQVVDSVFHRTEIMRDKTFFKKMLTSFMPEPLKMYNMLRTQIALATKASAEGRHGDAAKMSIRIATTMIPYFAVLTAVQSVMDAVRRTWTGDDDDDEKTYLELFWAHFQDNLVDNLNPMTWLPFFRDVWSNISGFDVKRPDLAALMQISDDAKMLYNYIIKDGDVSQNIFYISRKFAEDLSLLTGVPLKNLNREIESASLGVLSIMGFKQYSVYLKNKLKYQVDQDKSRFIDLYLKAEASGSAKDAKAIYDDLKKSGITEKDITDRIKNNYGKAFREALDDELFGAAVRSLDQMVSLGVSREDLVATVRANIADPYKEAFASGDTAAMDGCHKLLTAVGFTDADIKNYEYGTAKGYAKYQVYLVWQESGESAARAEARKWIGQYPELYKGGVDGMIYGIENSADTTKSDWDAGKWSRDSFDKFE